MKVIHVSQRDDLGTGGALRVAFEFVRRLSDYGIEVRMLFLYGAPGFVGSTLPDVCDYLGLENSRQIGQFWRLKRYLKKMNPDIVHFHDDLLWPQLVTAGKRPWKRVIHAHGGGTASPQPLKTRLLYHQHRHHADAVVCITDEAKASQTVNVGYDRNLLSVIYNAVDQHHYRRPTSVERAAARQVFGIPVQAPVVGFVGRLHNRTKGCDDFLRVLALLPVDFIGLMVGTGPDEQHLHALARQLGVADRVVFTGLMNDTVQAFHAMSAFCFVSRHEGFGLTIAEAMSCGVPVVGFACPGGSSEILTSETGDVVSNRDLAVMAEALQGACALESPWPLRLQKAHELLRDKFDWSVSTRKLAELYYKLLGEVAVPTSHGERLT